MPEITVSDNRVPHGRLQNGVLALELEAREGMWYPEKQEGPGLRVQAFGEPGHPPEIPGPIVRVPEGTEILVNLHNAIPGATLVIHGLYTRPGNLDDIIQLGPGESRMTNQINASSALTLPNLPATIVWILEGNCRLAAP